MFEICRSGGELAIWHDARHEAIFELAKLTLWLEDAIVKKKTSSRTIDSINPDAERAALRTPEIEERVEQTATVCAERIWKPLQRRWTKKYPQLVENQQKARGKRLLRRFSAAGVRRQHFSPVFSNRYWATGFKNQVRIYTRGLDLGVESRDVGYKKWGRESFLYSQDMERRLSLIEGDAKKPYEKLLNTIPISEQEKRCWIAFLVAQLVRTPSFLLQFLPGVQGIIDYAEKEGPEATLENFHKTRDRINLCLR